MDLQDANFENFEYTDLQQRSPDLGKSQAHHCCLQQGPLGIFSHFATEDSFFFFAACARGSIHIMVLHVLL